MNHTHSFLKRNLKKYSVLEHLKGLGVKVTSNAIKSGDTNKYSTLPRRR
jgi:hypothetical protein